jgi:hypothetical protein
MARKKAETSDGDEGVTDDVFDTRRMEERQSQHTEVTRRVDETERRNEVSEITHVSSLRPHNTEHLEHKHITSDECVTSPASTSTELAHAYADKTHIL